MGNIWLQSREIQIVGDNHDLSLLMPDEGILNFKEIISTTAEIGIINNFAEMSTNDSLIGRILTSQTKKLKLEILFNTGVYTKSDKLPKITKVQFDKLTVMDILKLLAKKQNERNIVTI